MGAMMLLAGVGYVWEGLKTGQMRCFGPHLEQKASREREPFAFWYSLFQSVVFGLLGLSMIAVVLLGFFGVFD
jgi:hypothetical protein